jgi:hypothetical protein
MLGCGRSFYHRDSADGQFLVTLFLIKEGVRPQTSKADRLSGREVLASLPYPGW